MTINKPPATQKRVINLRDIVHADIKRETKLSWDWYMTHVRNAAAGMSAQKFLGDNIAHQTTNIVPGKMVSFFYSPKGSDTLPYYDNFPLILPFGVDEKHFIGLNLHYLPPIYRAKLLIKLMEYADNDNLTPNTKLKLSWETLKHASQLKEIMPCIKMYLKGYTKSNFIVIPPVEWINVCFLPVERFKKASNETVWADSLKKIRG